jgi:hypothetical protein
MLRRQVNASEDGGCDPFVELAAAEVTLRDVVSPHFPGVVLHEENKCPALPLRRDDSRKNLMDLSDSQFVRSNVCRRPEFDLTDLGSVVGRPPDLADVNRYVSTLAASGTSRRK